MQGVPSTPTLPVLAERLYSMPQRKVQWVATDSEGKVVGVFPTRKRAFHFFDETSITLSKLVWNGFYHSEKAIDYDPYTDIRLKLYDPMFDD
jgi:hypothetical protein